MSSGFEAHAPNANVLPSVRSIFDMSAEALGQLRTWLEQNPPAIPVTQIVGYETNTVKIYKKATGSLTVANSSLETSIATEAIPASQMGTTGMLRLTIFGRWTNTTGIAGNQNLQIRVKFGGTTILSANDVVPNTNDRPVLLETTIANLGATNSQSVVSFWNVGNSIAAVTGIGNFGATNDRVSLMRNNTAVAIDTTVSQTLDVTIQHGIANANLTFLRDFYMLEFL